MTLTTARLIIWNPDSYAAAKVREAVTFILASFDATPEDLYRAMGIA